MQRHFLQVSGVDILACNEFKTSNDSSENVLKVIKKSGNGSTSHHPAIEPEDLQKFYNSLNIDTPCRPQMWLDVMLYLIRRGCENLRQMNTCTFGIGTDATGKKFVF